MVRMVEHDNGQIMSCDSEFEMNLETIFKLFTGKFAHILTTTTTITTTTLMIDMGDDGQ
jgi:hypothetical protein